MTQQSRTHTPIARGHDARSILRAQATVDFDATIEHLRERFHSEKRGVGGAAARGIEAVVMGAIRMMGVRKRLARDVDDLVDLALAVRDGADADKLAREHVLEKLRLREMSLFVRVHDPAFHEIVRRAERMFAKRLPDLARLATVEGARDYASLVVRAFPDRARVEAIIEENRRDVVSLIEHAERHPHLIRAVPDAWVPKAASIGKEFIGWKADAVRSDLDVFYDGASG